MNEIKRSEQIKQKIRLLVMDVDGTLTNGKIYMSSQGELLKVFDIKDGCGIHDLLPQEGIAPVIITGRTSKIVENRCRELDIAHCYQGCRDKVTKLKEVADAFGLIPDANGVYQEIAYIGDDINDLKCMHISGLVGCPSDAIDEIKNVADLVAHSKGGNGAVREFIEWIILGKGNDKNNSYYEDQFNHTVPKR